MDCIPDDFAAIEGIGLVGVSANEGATVRSRAKRRLARMGIFTMSLGCLMGRRASAFRETDLRDRFRCWDSGLWRTDRDSNPGYLAVYTLSKRAPSATRPSVRLNAGQPSNFTTMG